MGSEDFMTLLLTQLTHQDPMNPMQPHEFAAQLASFSSVEQLSQINSGMAYQIESLQLTAALSKTSFSAALLGKSVLAEGNKVSMPEEGTAQVQFDVGDGGGTATLRILDENGKEVATKDLGRLEGGRNSADLPDDLPPGKYTYEVVVEDADGAKVPVHTYVSGTVNRVLFEDGTIVLRIGDLEIPLDSLVEVASGDPNTGNDTGSSDNA
jgi:flagellar basal-body rod modification protein FlgD